jgi:pyrroloquinoline quinone biosynthesis protein E
MFISMFFKPESMNIELTTTCPLRCPQCYCKLEGGKNIDKDKAIEWLRQAGEMGVHSVLLSGGETLCYPHLYDVVRAAARYCGTVFTALSGYNFTGEVLNKLADAGISGIFISLNGSNEEINSLTRDGFSLAISALSLLKENEYSETWINWVMHSCNTDDFENVIKLAESFNVKNLVVMTVKPDSSHELKTAPTTEQIRAFSKIIRGYKGKVQIMVEACFSPMLAVVFDDEHKSNSNVGIGKGCGAGLTSFSVNVDAMLSPCRHLDYFESFDSLDEYWNQSSVLRQLRLLDYIKLPPCSECYYSPNCRHCIAINSKLHGNLYLGNNTCTLHLKTHFLI